MVATETTCDNTGVDPTVTAGGGGGEGIALTFLHTNEIFPVTFQMYSYKSLIIIGRMTKREKG